MPVISFKMNKVGKRERGEVEKSFVVSSLPASLLTSLRRQKMNRPEKISNVMILMMDKHLGNLVVSAPAINALKSFFSKKRCYLAVDDAYREIAEAVYGTDNLILYPRKQIQSSPLVKRAVLFLKFVSRLRKLSPDLVIDLEGRHVSSTIAFLTGAPVRAGSSTAVRAWCYNLKIPPSRKDDHRVYRYLGIASAIGAHCEDPYPGLKASDSKLESVKNKLNEKGVSMDKPIICIHPGAGRKFRQWTSEGFIDLADWLSSEGFQVVFVGGKGDLHKINEVTSHMKHQAYNLGGMLSLGELSALFQISRLFIGNDSGPLHIASAVGTIPVVGLFFRPTADKTWYPFTRESITLRGHAGCEECTGNSCTTLECTKNLSAAEVRNAVEKILVRKAVMH
jgi:ADP-heptose:LPS heptosyltransferase